MQVYDDPRFDGHDPGPGHPERVERLIAARAGLPDPLPRTWARHRPRLAAAEELRAVHTAAHVARVLSAAGQDRAMDADTVVSPGSVEAALLAAGAAIEAADALLDGAASLVLCRPPGHHATASQTMGFCLFNNAALAAARLAAAGRRVLVFDPDVHHGNGTEAIFWEHPDVLFVSLHRWPLYPGTGPASAIGEGAGRGTTLNVPLPAGSGDALYAEAMRARVLPAVRRFRPDACVISAGFDALAGDLLGGMDLSAQGMAAMWAAILADSVAAPLPALAVLEGGYDLDNLTAGIRACSAVLAGQQAPPLSADPVPERLRQALRRTPHPLLGGESD